ncbi:MAG: ankyrin repeat domain-containing protein [Armatimonadetes bacterium]|nr:ankyrin repeat domain-containing protein [Armatimonadota bacterium]
MRPVRIVRLTLALVAVLLLIWYGYAAVLRSSRNDALISAAWTGDITTVQRLLGQGADPNARHPWFERGASPLWRRERPDGYFTPLTLAARSGHTPIIQVLLEHGAGVNARGLWRRTALMEAVLGGHVDTVEALLDHGADVNARDLWGSTALTHAAFVGNARIAQVLLSRGADVKARDRRGRTALMDAAQYGVPGAVPVLLAHGVDVNVKDNRGKTALDLAREAERERYNPEKSRGGAQIVRLLRKAGAKKWTGAARRPYGRP